MNEVKQDNQRPTGKNDSGKIPENNIDQLSTEDYADGDFDLGVWEGEIEQMNADEFDEPGSPERSEM